MDLPELLDLAKVACKAKDDAALAKCLRVTKGALSNWRNGQRFPDWLACERIAEKTGMDPMLVLAVVRAARQGDSGCQGGGDPVADQLPLPGFRLAAA